MMDSTTNSVRRSSREGKGIPPERLGIRNNPTGSQGKRSKVSNETSSTSVRKQEVDIGADEKLLKIKTEISEKQSQLQVAESKMEISQIKLDGIQKKVDDGIADDEMVKAAEQIEIDLLNLKLEIKTLKAQLEGMLSISDLKIKIIERQRQVEHEKIDLEIIDNKKLSLSDEDEAQKNDRVESWTDEQFNRTNPQMHRITADVENDARDDDEYSHVSHRSKPFYNSRGGHVYPTSYVQRESQKIHDYNKELSQQQAKAKENAQVKLNAYSAPTWNPGAEEWNPVKPAFSHEYGYGQRQAQAQCSGQDGSNDVVGQLVHALGQAFGTGRQEERIIIKSGVDKDLPKFGGKPEDWVIFQSEFQRTTAKYKIDESENIVRLRKSLHGTAKDTVMHMLTNVRNVDSVMEALKERFGEPKHVINALATKAKNCPNVTVGKPETIIELGLAVQALVANIKTFKQIGYLHSMELMDSLVKKLSPELRMKWHEWGFTGVNNCDNLDDFAKWIKTVMKYAYKYEDCKIKDESDERRESKRRRGSGSVNTASGESDYENKTKTGCHCCAKKNHGLEKCYFFPKKTADERWEIVKSNKLCISCLKPGHRINDCKNPVKCDKPGCKKQHHPTLHGDGNRKWNSSKSGDGYVKAPTDNSGDCDNSTTPFPTVTDGAQAKDCDGNIMATIISGCDGPLPIVQVKVKGPNGERKVYALLDSGASRSLITRELAKELGIQGKVMDYSFTGINGESVRENSAEKVNFEICGVYRGAEFHTLNSAMTVEKLNMRPYSINMDEVKHRWQHLKRVKARTLVKVSPDIIVGNNNPYLILCRESVFGKPDEPVGWRSKLGWTVSGEFDYGGHGAMNAMYGGIENDNYLHNLIKTSFTTDDFGVKISARNGKNFNEKRAYEILESTTKLTDDGCWETGLLWKDGNVQLPESDKTAFKRLLYTERKMKDPEFAQLYKEKIHEYSEKGYIRKLKPEEIDQGGIRKWYIPHFGVTNPNKPGKFRLVFDAAAESHGTCLNDHLLKGPDLIRPLTAILWNFRKHQIALTGDIADMFHRVKIIENDKASQRFLWRDGDTSKDPYHYHMEVMIFGASSSPCSAIYAKNKNATKFMDKYPRSVEVIHNDFYVDDCLTGADTTEEAIKLRKEISEIHDAGGFSVRKWTSNSGDVLASIPKELTTDGGKSLEEKGLLPTERVLGMSWDPNEDDFTFKLGLHKVKQRVLDGEIPTKREMCGLVMSVFDPVGFVNHFKVKGLMLLQETWCSGIGWDDEIPHETFKKWIKWLGMLYDITNMKIQRCYSPSLVNADCIQLHTFMDASGEAFAAVSYLRIMNKDIVDLAFVSSKVKVAPLKKLTIPRLELQAALLGTRLATTICGELKLKISSRVFWSDSKTVIQWIRSQTGKFKEFVSNRVGEIQESTDPTEWRWVPTKLNVADQATRFESKISFEANCDWITGPDFLTKCETEWPMEEKEAIIATTLGDDLRSGFSTDESCGLSSGEKNTNSIPDPARFSSYLRFWRATAAVLRAAEIWKNNNAKIKSYESFRIQPEDLTEAEKLIWRSVQMETYPDEVNSLKLGHHISKKSKLWRLVPVLDTDGIIRINGRIGNAKNVPHDTKFPVILPSKHRVTELLVDLEHVKNAHQGAETILSNLRKKYWIIDARQSVKRSHMRCLVCKLKKVKPMIPQMGNLPDYRLCSRQPAFTFTGVDYFGPMEVTVGRHHEKRWGALFCCMVTRAVHIEIAHGLTTDEYMMALSRFIDSRGRPEVIFSDNGTNFVRANKDLKAAFGEISMDKILQMGKFQEIKCRFSVPTASHMGGAWERLIQSVKKCLKSVLREKYPKDTTLITAMKAVENIVNSRPLTYVSNDSTDPNPITPNHLLRGGVDIGPGIPAVMDTSDNFIKQQWKRAQTLADHFWERWAKEYLPKLIPREKWQEVSDQLQIGDLVFILDDQLPRNCWQRGYVSKLFAGADKQVRVVDVTTRDFKSGRASVYRRPVTKLCPLGLRMEIKGPKVS